MPKKISKRQPSIQKIVYRLQSHMTDSEYIAEESDACSLWGLTMKDIWSSLEMIWFALLQHIFKKRWTIFDKTNLDNYQVWF